MVDLHRVFGWNASLPDYLIHAEGYTRRAGDRDGSGGGIECSVFDEHGLIPVVTTDFTSGEVLMHAYMNAEALTQTITLGEATTS